MCDFYVIQLQDILPIENHSFLDIFSLTKINIKIQIRQY